MPRDEYDDLIRRIDELERRAVEPRIPAIPMPMPTQPYGPGWDWRPRRYPEVIPMMPGTTSDRTDGGYGYGPAGH